MNIELELVENTKWWWRARVRKPNPCSLISVVCNDFNCLFLYYCCELFGLQRVRVRGFRWRRSTRWYGRWKSTTEKKRRKRRSLGWVGKIRLRRILVFPTIGLLRNSNSKPLKLEGRRPLRNWRKRKSNARIMFIMICYVTWSAKWMNK